MSQRWIRLGQYLLYPRDDLCRATLQDRLVHLCFHRGGVVGSRVEWSEERRGPWQVALGLCNSRLARERIEVVRCNIKNLIKLPQCFGETTQCDVGIRVLGEHVNIARIEALGFVEVTLAFVPLASPPRDIRQ